MTTTGPTIGLQQRRLRAPLLCLMASLPVVALAGDAVVPAAVPAVETSPVAVAPGVPRIEALLVAAQAAQLHRDPHWLTLLHYAGGVTGQRSLIDDPTFFLSPQGPRDPWA